MNRIIPYEGNEPYIFVSYAHKDSDRVLPIIGELQERGYRIWYDEGITPGREWDAVISAHIKNCVFFLALISEQYLGSENCKDELNWVRELRKSRLLVYLEKVALPDEMAMRLGRLQAIYQYVYDDQALFYEKLSAADGIACCRDEGAELSSEQPEEPEKPKEPKESQTSPVKEEQPSKHKAKARPARWRRFLPPGFRTGSPIHMVLAVLGYLFIFAFGLRMGEDLTSFAAWILRKVTFILIGLSVVFVSADYCGIQSKLPLTRSKNLVLRVVGIVLYDVALSWVLFMADVLLEIILSV